MDGLIRHLTSYLKAAMSPNKICVAYVLIGPRGGGALSGHAHAGALVAATPVVALEVVESQFAAVTVLSLNVFLQRKRVTKFMGPFKA